MARGQGELTDGLGGASDGVWVGNGVIDRTATVCGLGCYRIRRRVSWVATGRSCGLPLGDGRGDGGAQPLDLLVGAHLLCAHQAAYALHLARG